MAHTRGAASDGSPGASPLRGVPQASGLKGALVCSTVSAQEYDESRSIDSAVTVFYDITCAYVLIQLLSLLYYCCCCAAAV